VIVARCIAKVTLLTDLSGSMEASEAEELRQLAQRVCENVSSYVGFQLEGAARWSLVVGRGW
jgi:hypothetical protein